MQNDSIDNYRPLTARVYDRIVKPLLTAAKSAGDIGSVPQVQNTIEACYRVYTGPKATEGHLPPVIIRLRNSAIKVAILKHRRRHTPEPTDQEKALGAKNFIIVEELTMPAHKLLLDLKKDSRVDKVWSINGQLHFSLQGKQGYCKVRSVFESVEEILGRALPAGPSPSTA